MSRLIVFLSLLQSCNTMPMHLGHTGSNSEEMPHVGSMYGIGFPHYSQMVQLHQALPWQPFSWLPQNAAKYQQISHHAPQLQKKNPHQLQPQLTGPNSQLKHQHVTRQPQQPLQLPPAPNPQIPQMFPVFPGEINPYQQFWPQLNNYLGYFGMGGRRPYNSEEINEDEEALEKESPKSESTVAEASNSTTDTNSTTVDKNQGNNTTHNVSLPSDSQNQRLNSHNVSPDGVPVLPSNHGSDINMLTHASKPFQQAVLRNPQHKYYAIDKVTVGSGDHHNGIRLVTHLINQGRFTNSHTSGNLGYVRETQHFDHDKHSDRATIVQGSHHNGPRGTSQDTASLPRYESVRPHTRHNNGQNQNRQTREHSTWLINKNNIPKPKMIILDPERNEYLSEYNRQLNVEHQQAMPRGLLTNHQNIQPQKNEGNRKNNVHHNKPNVIGQNSKPLLNSEGPFADNNYYEKDVNVLLRDSLWLNRQGYPDMTIIPSGQQQGKIYIVSPTAPNNIPVHSDSQRQRKGDSLNHAVGEAKEQSSPPSNPLGQRNVILPKNNIYVQTRIAPYTEKQSWANHLEFAPVESNLHNSVDTHQSPASQIGRELYNNDRMSLSQRINAEPSMHTEQVYFPANQPLHQIMDSPIYKVIDSLDHNRYFADYNVDSRIQNKNGPYSTNSQFEPMETVYYIIRHEPRLGQVDPIYLPLSPLTEKHSWSNNQDNFDLTTQKDNANDDMYPSGMRGQSPYQRGTGMDHTGPRYYNCYLPVIENDQTRGLPDQLLYVCCKHIQTEQGTDGKLENSDDFRVTLQEYNEWLPYQDRTHRQHTRNIVDPPLTPTCNSSNNENILSSGGEHSEVFPHSTKGCDGQTSEHTYRSFGVVDKKLCSARGDADNYLPLIEDTSTSPINNGFAFKRSDLPPMIAQEGTLPSVTENDARLKKAPGKLLSILICPKDMQRISQANTGASKPNAFSLKHDIPTHDEFSMLHQPSENINGPVSGVADCLILNK